MRLQIDFQSERHFWQVSCEARSERRAIWSSLIGFYSRPEQRFAASRALYIVHISKSELGKDLLSIIGSNNKNGGVVIQGKPMLCFLNKTFF